MLQYSGSRMDLYKLCNCMHLPTTGKIVLTVHITVLPEPRLVAALITIGTTKHMFGMNVIEYKCGDVNHFGSNDVH